MKAITAKEAIRIGEKTGYPPTEGDGRTYYATDRDETELWEFDTKRERDEFVQRALNEEGLAMAETCAWFGGAI